MATLPLLRHMHLRLTKSMDERLGRALQSLDRQPKLKTVGDEYSPPVHVVLESIAPRCRLFHCFAHHVHQIFRWVRPPRINPVIAPEAMLKLVRTSQKPSHASRA